MGRKMRDRNSEEHKRTNKENKKCRNEQKENRKTGVSSTNLYNYF